MTPRKAIHLSWFLWETSSGAFLSQQDGSRASGPGDRPGRRLPAHELHTGQARSPDNCGGRLAGKRAGKLGAWSNPRVGKREGRGAKERLGGLAKQKIGREGEKEWLGGWTKKRQPENNKPNVGRLKHILGRLNWASCTPKPGSWMSEQDTMEA